MAQITELGDETDLKWIFNVSYAVGPRSPNRRDDVLMVQHIFNKLLPYVEFKGPDGSRITSYLSRDGICGPKTNAAILAYQQNLKSRGSVVWVDGIIGSSNKSGWTPVHGDQYTIVFMNRDHVKFYGKMLSDTEFPAEVVAALKRNSPNLFQGQ